VLRARGDQLAARALQEEALALQREQEDRMSIANSLCHLADLARDENDCVTARSLYAESATLRQELGDQPGIAECLEGLAMVAVSAPPEADRAAQSARAVRLLAAAATLRAAIECPLSPADAAEIDDRLARLRKELGTQRFDAAWEAGSRTTPEQALVDGSGA
jgi:hypothetical protein